MTKQGNCSFHPACRKLRIEFKPMRFKNQFVLVSGAGQNTGLGIAECFAAEGATVFLNDRTPDIVEKAIAALRKKGYKLLEAAPADIGSRAEVEEMFLSIGARCGRLDVVVNNAAHLGIGPGPLETDLEFFENVVRVNLTGTFHVSQQAALLMRPQGGAIVNISSNVTTRAIRNKTAYIASKGGIDALTTSLALDLAPFRIRVNCVVPGYIHSDRWTTLAESSVKRRRSNVPLGIEAMPQDIGRAAVFLASADAGNITGSRLHVDGGCAAQHMPLDTDV